MDKILGPTGRLLVGAVFICILISLCVAAADHDLPDLQKKLKDAKYDPFNHNNREFLAKQPDARLSLGLLPSEENIVLSESRSIEQVPDLKVMNAVKERYIVYDGKQYGDPGARRLANSLDVSVTGQGNVNEVLPIEMSEDNYLDKNIDKIVDNAFNTSMMDTSMNNEGKGGQMVRNAQLQQLGNNLDINVAGISVSAINTAQGGSAVATSNIIIKPVQIIICPSEVEEKLK